MNISKGFATVTAIGIAVLVIIIGGIVYLTGDKAMQTTEIVTSDTETKSDSVMKKENVATGTVMEGTNEPTTQSTGTMMQGENATTTNEGVMTKEKGTYESYSPEKVSLASKGKVLLFFHANWCPVCRAIESEINGDLSRIPDGVHILKVNYDSEIALRQKYGVTTQHTFVQVNAEGSLIAKWSNATTLAATLANIK